MRLRIFICLLIFLLISVKPYSTFNVNFHYNYNLQVEPFNTKIHKRELQQSAAPLDKASLSFVGFEKVDSVPILFPLDVCILQVGAELKYAAALHLNKSGLQHFVVLKMMNGSYEQVMSVPKPNAVAMDCKQFENKGYISIAMNVSKPIEKNPEDATVIFEISGDRVLPVQYFNTSNLLTNYFYVGNNEFFLLQLVANESACPYFKWCDQIFSHLGYIPCNKAHHLEPFTMNDEGYVAVAKNGDEQTNRKDTNLNIYKFSQETQKFELFQKIKMNGEGTGDVRHFQVFGEHEGAKHFLVYGNSQDSVIYKFNDKDQFLPHQKLALTGVKKFLPLQSQKVHGSCILLIACGKNDIKVFNLEDGKFREESQVHFKGHNFRLYEENLQIHVIIVNERTKENKANIYLPAFKKEKSIANLKKQIIDWAHYEAEKLKMVNIEDLSIKVQEKLQLLEKSKLKLKRNIDSSHINTVTTESLVYPKKKMSANYWKALYYINQGLDVLEEELSEKQQRVKRQSQNDEDEQIENMEYIYDTLNIKTLTINKNLEAKRINNIDLQFPEFKEILTPKITIKDKYSKPMLERSYPNADLDYLQDNEMLHIRNLQINGKLNEYTWQNLLNNTLKREAEIQYIKSSIKIRNLETPRVVVTNNAVNRQHLSSLIPIDGGEYVIEQDIQFAEPITAKNVEIHQRLNNVHVYEGKFDVLLRRSNETQIIEGPKSLNNVKVMEPITIAGQMLGKHLESITPNKAIHQPITLQGDFMINGDVDINFRLKAADIIDLREKMSIKQTLEQGIRMDKHLEEVKLKFLQPLKANNSLVSFINKNDLQRLVKLNQDEIQIVEGEKTFTGSLEIRRGFSEVKNLNGVDMEKLEKDSFLKNNNQTIKIPMKFNKIQANSVNSSAILLNNRNLTDYLFKSSNQTIKGNLVIDNLKVKSLKVENLNTNNKIFQQNIQDIYRQKSRNAPQQQEVFVKNQKFHGSIYVKNLVLNSTINERNVDDIEKNLLQLEGNIKYVGNFKFNYPMNVTQLTFYGKLNDINAQDFGRCWLQKNSQQQQQEFVGPQTVRTVNAENGIHFQGKLNGFTMNDFYSKTYWINRDEYLSDVEFENPIEISSSLTTQTLNHRYIPEELLLLSEAQQLFHPIIIKGDLEVQSPGLNVTIMKNINIQALLKYLHDDYMDGLYVENAYFNQGPPSYKKLNYRSIPYVLDNVWLANENVILPQHIEINDAYFEGLLEFEGDMNNMNLEFLKETYFSRTKSQNISAKMVFSKGVVFEEDIEANDIQLFGPIKEGKSETSFDFMQFVENTLKTSGHPHTIPGNWSLLEAIIDGNLNQVLINQLNLVDDIVHTTVVHRGVQPFVIKARKRFMHDVSIENLLAEPSSLLNNIPVAKWIKDAVYLYENYTIFGTTKMSSLNVFNDLGVMGQLNNISFNENSLLLQDSKQTLPGKLRITSHLKGEKRFLTNNIENLYADFINSEYMPGLMDNLIAVATNVEISNHVVFKEPLNVEKYQGPEGLLTQTRWLKRDLKGKSQENVENVGNINGRDLDTMQDFELITDYLRNITKDRFYVLDHFEIRQILNINPSQVQSFSFKLQSGDVVDVMILLDTLSNNVTFYKWLPGSNKFMEDQDFNWLPKNPALLNIIQKMSMMTNKEPIDVDYLKEFISKLNKKIPNTNLDIEFWNETCLIIYSTSINTPVFKINCVDFNRQMQSTEIMARTTSSNIQQILSLNRSSLALITNNSLEIWNLTLGKLKLAQKFAVNNPRQLSSVVLEGRRYLAVITKAMPTSLNSGSIEIYRSLKDDRHFVLWQTLSCPHPTKIEYSYIAQSKDLLLYVLTDLKEKPLIFYQYQGNVLGFQEILTNSILPPHGMDVKSLEIKSSPHFMLGVLGRDKLTIVEIVLRKM